MDKRRLLAHWKDEGDSAYLYRVLASLEQNKQRQSIFERLAGVETEHQEIYRRALEHLGVKPPAHRPTARAQLLAWLARRGSAGMVLNLRVRDEASEVRTYLRESANGGQDGLIDEAQDVARDEAHHAQVLTQMQGNAREPWHRTGSGGFLRNVIYGFNDGLTANFGLVMGVLGATVTPDVLVVTGLSGLAADALSMGASGFLAAKSEQEVFAHEIAMEREEMELMPETETEELALLYEARGVPAEMAKKTAEEVMADPDRGLQEKAREELGIGEEAASPLREGVVTGVATAFGAVIPVLPFLFAAGAVAVWVAFAVSMAAHFLVGAARSLFTGRGVFRSGIDMFLVGLGVAMGGYLVGALISGHL